MMVRPARLSDAQSMARVYVLTWQATYRNILPDRYLDAMSFGDFTKTFEKSIANSTLINLVAENQDRSIVGFCTAGQRHQERSIFSSEIFTLYVSRHQQRQGIGQALLEELADQLSQRRLYSVSVRVLGLNPYRRFYEKMGGVMADKRPIAFAGTHLEAVVYGWISLDLLGP